MEREAYIDDLVSVIMPAYNSAEYISDAVKSVLLQSYSNLELIICDDASDDETVADAKKASSDDPRVIILRNETNAGVAAARNKAISKASGRYIAFLDSDDIWEKDKLSEQLKFMKDNGCALCYSSYGFINELGEPIKNRMAIIRDSADYKSLLKNNFIGMLTVVIDRKTTGSVKFSSNRHEDLILWLGLAKKKLPMKGMNKPLAKYRVSQQSLSGNKLKAAAWRWNVYRKSENLNFFTSIWYMTFYIVNSIVKRIAT